MKSYIQDLCGDENPVDIDVAILQCMLQDVIFEKLVDSMTNKTAIDKAHGIVWDFLSKHKPKLN